MKVKPILNEAQQRSLSVSLRLMEEKLLMLQLMACHGDFQGALFRLRVDLDDGQEEDLIQQIEKLRSQIHLLKEQFNLSPRTVNFSDLLSGTESYFWTVLCDQKSEKLNRYGKVSPELQTILDPLIDQLILELKTMAEGIHSPQKAQHKSGTDGKKQ